MNRVTRHRRVGYGLTVLLMVLLSVTHAATIVTVKVTVVARPSCIINDDRPIVVEFGDVVTTRVDGSSYRLPVIYTLHCKDTISNAMKLQVQGAGADFDGEVLQTNQTGLGIELQQGDSKLPVNSWLNFTYPNKPELWAVPVKQGGVTLTGGEFTAGATMKVDYQ